MAHPLTPVAHPFNTTENNTFTWHPPPFVGGRPVDQRSLIEGECLSECSNWLFEYQGCIRRVSARTDGKGHCQGQYEELYMCVDHCVGHHIMPMLRGN